LQASAQFYQAVSKDEYLRAAESYKHLAQTRQQKDWLKQVALYMQARSVHRAGQTQWNGLYEDTKPPVMGLMSTLDKELIKHSGIIFNQYLLLYPHGYFAESAKGLLTDRIPHLLRDNDQRVYTRINHDLSKDYSHDPHAFTLTFNKFLNYLVDSPEPEINFQNDPAWIIVYGVLREEIGSQNAIAAIKHNAQRFAHYPGLQKFTTEVLLFRAKNYSAVIQSTNDLIVQNKPLTISRAVLRAKAQANNNDTKSALATWQNIATARQTKQSDFKGKDDNIADLRLAGLYAKQHNWQGLVQAQNQLIKEEIITDFLYFAAPKKELYQLLQNKTLPQTSRDLIGTILLKRYLFAGQYKEMTKIYSSLSGNSELEPIKKTIIQLARNPKNPTAQFTLAKYLVSNAMLVPDSDMGSNEGPSKIEELSPYCTACNNYAKESAQFKTPYLLWQGVANYYQQHQLKSEQEAETLHQLVVCMQPGSNQRDCQWTAIHGDRDYPDRSQQYFQRLHRLYPHSQWTKDTPYYY